MKLSGIGVITNPHLSTLTPLMYVVSFLIVMIDSESVYMYHWLAYLQPKMLKMQRK